MSQAGLGAGLGPWHEKLTHRSQRQLHCRCLVLYFFWIQCLYMPEPKCVELRPHAGSARQCCALHARKPERSQCLLPLHEVASFFPSPSASYMLIRVARGSMTSGMFGQNVKQSWEDHKKSCSIDPATEKQQKPLLLIITHN